MSPEGRILTEEEVAAAAESPLVATEYLADLLVSHETLRALARALAEALRDTFAVATALDTKLPEGGYGFRTEYLSAPEVLARAAHLLEGKS